MRDLDVQANQTRRSHLLGYFIREERDCPPSVNAGQHSDGACRDGDAIEPRPQQAEGDRRDPQRPAQIPDSTTWPALSSAPCRTAWGEDTDIVPFHRGVPQCVGRGLGRSELTTSIVEAIGAEESLATPVRLAAAVADQQGLQPESQASSEGPFAWSPSSDSGTIGFFPTVMMKSVIRLAITGPR